MFRLMELQGRRQHWGSKTLAVLKKTQVAT